MRRFQTFSTEPPIMANLLFGKPRIRGLLYFANFDWDALAGRATKAPWQPNLKKLQQSWEPCNGEAIEEGETDGKLEPGMEWAKDF